MRLLRFFPVSIVCLLVAVQSNATHIKAADLYAKVNPFNLTTDNPHRNILFTLNLYCDMKSVDNAQDPSDFCRGLGNCATFNFGDGDVAKDVHYIGKPLNVGNNTYLIVFQFYHKYTADKFYEASYFEENRNNGILNLTTPSNSLAFYIKMGITIESGFGSNQTPQMSIPPVDLAAVNRIFIHNPGASDVNGDSIAYKLYEPQIAPGQFDPKYVDPQLKYPGNTQDGLSNATLALYNKKEGVRKPGDLVWNAPSVKGLYNIAILIEEWRIIGTIRQRISYSIRDMQIDVKDSKNNPPVITLREDACISPGVPYKSPVQVTDQDKDNITLVPYGELFQPPSSGATVFPSGSLVAVPVIFNTEFSWTPTCNHVRRRPYQVFFKATDTYITPLTDIKSFMLTIVGPRPTGLDKKVDSVSNNIILTWDKYACAGAAQSMEIYRKVGCETVTLKNCVLGKPSSEYVLIGKVRIDTLNFTDSTAKRGNKYTYAIAALFEDNFKITSNSYPSESVCAELPIIAPIINKVSFEGINKDQVLIAWGKPVDIDTSKVKGPYQYQLFRKAVGAAKYDSLILFSSTNKLTDGSFLDTKILPGTDYVYYVKLTYFSNTGTMKELQDSSEISTNVLLTATSISGGVRLQWKANTPWQNSINGLYHYIWAKGPNDNGFTKIDSVTFNQGTQTYQYDDYRNRTGDLSRLCDTMTYYVTTAGSYKNPKIKPDTIYNNSFMVKGTILNDIAPQSPVLESFAYDCSTFSQTYPFKNALSWNKITSAVPCFKIVGYNIYFSSKSNDENMALVGRVDTSDNPAFTHSNLTSVAGCYAVTAFDNLGNESVKSEKLCLNNCSLFDLPNVFTPNGSGVNDLFRPIPPSPRFVESVKFSVFNRWGTKVFEKSDDVNLNWDGSGLPDGVYFYTARVKFVSADENNSTKDLKGWIQIIR